MLGCQVLVAWYTHVRLTELLSKLSTQRVKIPNSLSIQSSMIHQWSIFFQFPTLDLFSLFPLNVTFPFRYLGGCWDRFFYRFTRLLGFPNWFGCLITGLINWFHRWIAGLLVSVLFYIPKFRDQSEKLHLGFVLVLILDGFEFGVLFDVVNFILVMWWCFVKWAFVVNSIN